MKKMWYTMAVALTAATLTACGGESGTGETQSSTVATQAQQTTQVQTESQTQKGQLVSWVTKDVDTSGFAAPQISTVNITNSVKNDVVETPFNFNVEDVKAKIEKNAFVTNQYVLALSKGDYTYANTYDDIGTKLKYRVIDSVGGVAKDKATSNQAYYNDFTVTFTRETNKYSNYNRIYINFGDVEPSDDFQENVYGVLSDALGKEYADLLVYAKDADGKNHSDPVKNDIEVGDYINIKGGSYLFNRNYYESSGKVNLSFTLELTKVDGVNNYFEYYDGGYESVATDIQYGIDKVITGDVGNIDYRKADTFLDKYMKSGVTGYAKTFITDMSTEYTVADNGVKVTKNAVECQRSSDGYKTFLMPTTELEYTIIEDADGISEMKVKITGITDYIDKTGTDKNTAYTQLFEVGKKRVNCLFPEIDLSKDSYAGMTDSYMTKDVAIMINNVELKGKLTFKMGDTAEVLNSYSSSYTIELSYTK